VNAKLGLLAVVLLTIHPHAARAQEVGRDAAARLEYPPIRFEPTLPVEHSVEGVPVLFLEDPTVPLATVYVRFKGGYGRFGRENYAAGTALPSMLRYGGVEGMAPDSVDAALEYYAIQTSFGGAGGSLFSTMNTLTAHLPEAMDLWRLLLTRPAFDSAQIEIWRGRQLENVRRRTDDPARLAFSEFNRLLYGDHPIGWEMESADLEPDRLRPERFRDLHARIVCREQLVVGVAGDVGWDEIEPHLASLVAALPPCADSLPPEPVPEIRREPGVFLIEKKLDQAVIVMAHPTAVHLADDPEYYAVTIANSILGGGGFSSRILSRVRTEEGFAYSAASLWTTPRRFDGLVGAITRTRPENARPAVDVILKTMEEVRDAPPTADEMRTAIDRIVNGFVFNFETPGQIVSRMMFYVAQDLPEDWLERYLDGVQRVTAEDVRRAFADHLHPERMTIMVVGDPDRIGTDAWAGLGPVTVLEVR
jgi:zinc protease